MEAILGIFLVFVAAYYGAFGTIIKTRDVFSSIIFKAIPVGTAVVALILALAHYGFIVQAG